MHMKRVQGDAFKNLRKGGKWRDIDIIASNFSGYEIRLFMLGKRTPREKSVYLNRVYKNVISKKTNEGMNYGDGKIDTTINDYIDTVCSKFPLVPKSDI